MIFVTGGTGLLGSQLLFDLTSRNLPVRALYRSEKRLGRVRQLFQYRNSEKGNDYFDSIEWVQGDILDISLLIEQMDGCEYVYHCAALVSFHPSDYGRLFKINREGTFNVVNACLATNIKKLCHVSSTAAIGGDNTESITEETKWKSGSVTSGYSLSKYGAEREVWRAIEEGLNAVIINPCVIFGPGDWDESSLAIFKTVEKGLAFYPPGSNATVDVRDVSYCMISLMESPIHSERFLCIGSNQSFRELMTTIAEEIKVAPPSKPVKKWLVNAARILLSIVNGIAGRKSSITKETVKNLFSDKRYDASKIKKATECTFYTLEEQVEDAVAGRLH